MDYFTNTFLDIVDTLSLTFVGESIYPPLRELMDAVEAMKCQSDNGLKDLGLHTIKLHDQRLISDEQCYAILKVLKEQMENN